MWGKIRYLTLMCSFCSLDTYIGVVHCKALIKNEYQNDMCYNHIGLCTQNISTMLGSIGESNGRAGLCDYLKEKDTLHFDFM